MFSKCSYLSFGKEIGHPLSTYATGGLEGWGSSKMFTGAYRERGVSRLMCTYVITRSFSCFCLMLPCFICRNLTLPSFRKHVFVRNGLISVVMK